MTQISARRKISALQQLRIVGLLEGVSYLVLLGIAMPLKYYAGYPLAVKYTGWAHGLLFVLFVMAVVQAAFVLRWGFFRALIAFVASLLPFGTFVLDISLRKEERHLLADDTTTVR